MEVGVAYIAVGTMGAIGGALGLAVAADAPKVQEASPSLGDKTDATPRPDGEGVAGPS
jgi:hypothetical protein